LKVAISVFLSIILLILLSGCNDIDTNSSKNQQSKTFIDSKNSVDLQTEQKITSNDSNKTNNQFGSSVSLNNQYMIVGAEYANGDSNNSGVAYIYKKDGADYSLVSRVVGSDTKEREYFGHSVDIDGNYAIVGSYYEGTVYKNSYNASLNTLSRAKYGGVGRVYLFKNSGDDNFNQIAKIEPKDSDKTPYGNFGNSLVIKNDYIVIGAEFSDANSTSKSAGAVFVFQNDGNDNITQIAKLIPDDSQENMRFGYSVDMNEDKIFVGSIKSINQNVQSGAVYVFEKDSNNQFKQTAKLIGSDALNNDFFGCSISSWKDYLVVGACGYDGLYEDSGAVYVFSYDGKKYNEVAKILVNDATGYDRLGFSIAVFDDIIVAGAPNSKVDSNYKSGVVYIFKNTGNDKFIQVAKINGTQSSGYFAKSLSIDDLVLAVGAPFEDNTAQNAGSVYIVDLNQSQIIQGVDH